jgi:hypothetical protein
MTRARSMAVILAALVCLSLPIRVGAQPNNPNVREAAKHFQRGVTLYSEADYRGALVEFQRAYGLAPNAAVLYNVGQTEFQLRDYAAALATFERFLAGTGPTDGHRAEVEANVRELRSRVGELTIASIPPGAEISVDDRVVGRTPLEKPVIVGVGHLKVSATLAGRPTITRYVDVAAEDKAAVTLQLPEPAAAASAEPTAPPGGGPMDGGPVGGSTGGRSSRRILGWVATGVLAGGAVAFGLLASNESKDLQRQRDVFPTSTSRLDHLAHLTTTYAILADSLAAAAVVTAAITLFSGGDAAHAETHPARGAAIGVGPTSLTVAVTF